MAKKLSVKEKLSHCAGCENEYYNNRGTSAAANDLCWSINSATLELRKKVPLHQRPPWNQKAKRVLSCYHEKGYVFIVPASTRRQSSRRRGSQRKGVRI